MKIEIDKPVIPQFVADWIEEAKEERYISTLFGKKLSHEMYIWSAENTVYKEELVATAFLYGYEVEQKPLYYARVKGCELIRHDFNKPYWTLEIDDLFISFNGDIDNDEYHTRMTKEEWNKLGINSLNADFEKVEE